MFCRATKREIEGIGFIRRKVKVIKCYCIDDNQIYPQYCAWAVSNIYSNLMFPLDLFTEEKQVCIYILYINNIM